MNPEVLRRRNASLHDRIQEVLQMHPELRDGTEAIALRQDLHVEAAAPFLERTGEKLEERARAIIERRPDLEYYFGNLIQRRLSGLVKPNSKPPSALTRRSASRPSA
jgi:hypothetical protein